MKIFLCDDNIKHLEFYREKLNEMANKYHQIIEFQQFEDGNKMLFALADQKQSVDALFLDINMPEIDGITVAEKLREAEFSGEVVFLTVSKEHFLPAFDVKAFNYIVKGETSTERFEKIFQDIIQIANEKEREYILLSGGGEHRKIEINSIHYFEVQSRIVTVHYKDREFEFFTTLGKIENQLYNRGFIRVHRAFLVAQRSIQEIYHDALLMKNGDQVPIGRTYQKDVQKLLKEMM